MQTKDKNNKSICTENTQPEVPLTAEMVADIAGVSESLVKKVRSGKRATDTPAGKRVEIAEELWAEGSNLLITEIKKIVKL